MDLFLKVKSEAYNVINFIIMTEKQTGAQVKVIQSDWGLNTKFSVLILKGKV